MARKRVQKFVFDRSYFEAIRCLPVDMRQRCLFAIIDYALDGEWPTSGTIEEALVTVCADRIDDDLAELLWCDVWQQEEENNNG